MLVIGRAIPRVVMELALMNVKDIAITAGIVYLGLYLYNTGNLPGVKK